MYIAKLIDILEPEDRGTAILSMFANDALACVQGRTHAEAVIKANEMITQMTAKLHDLGMTCVNQKTRVACFGKVLKLKLPTMRLRLYGNILRI